MCIQFLSDLNCFSGSRFFTVQFPFPISHCDQLILRMEQIQHGSSPTTSTSLPAATIFDAPVDGSVVRLEAAAPNNSLASKQHTRGSLRASGSFSSTLRLLNFIAFSSRACHRDLSLACRPRTVNPRPTTRCWWTKTDYRGHHRTVHL